ncbi:MAG: V-type ATP synthase subunit D [Candidatus Lokiarchaeota archaeon]|nr:V-type ATP synthase subunit D [Candidatus Lokiarchaeota archaeon]MBD3198645.1 V-type ATP synthase subunit D [Candidatus Lokiarchaeota archaeon]
MESIKNLLIKTIIGGCKLDISFKKLKPTKTNLLKLEDRLGFIDKGKEFLEYKREQLIQEIKTMWRTYKEHRKNYFNILAKTMLKLNETYKEMGKRKVLLISKISEIQYKPKIEISYLKKMGIVVSQINYKLIEEEKLPPYSFENTSHHLEELRNLTAELFEKMILLAETEDVILKYGFNFKKINRRIQGIKNIIKPRLESDIKDIEKILEEVERENFIRLKQTKEIIKTN